MDNHTRDGRSGSWEAQHVEVLAVSGQIING